MDQYIRVRKIGEGSFGQALLVKGRKDGKHYVIKEINFVKMNRRERDEARKEVKVLSQMKHPNIVAYQDSFEEKGSLHIVMDYCDGGDLYKHINNQRGQLFPEDKILNWFVQLCLALKHVHDRKILHRDIKSQNVFLTKKGVVKLGDFGIARVLNSTVELARTCIGTPYYLSPEICENKPYNNKSDIWALGCVLYELTTLKHAFEAGNLRNLIMKIVRGSYPPLPSCYSRELRQLVDSCLKNHPRDRPSINSILRLPFIQQRIEKLLSETVAAEEFSHTVLHKKKVEPVSRPLPQKQPAQLAIQGHHYDPVGVYGERRVSDDKRRVVLKPKAKPNGPSHNPAGPRRPSVGLAEKKKELEEKARVQREEIIKQKKVEGQMKLDQQMKKQEMIRIQQAKQRASINWQNALAEPQEKEEPLIKGGKENELQPHQEVVSNFHQLRMEAAANKVKAEGHIIGVAKPNKGVVVCNNNKGQPSNKAEQEYLARLEAIRRQNFQERKRIQQRVSIFHHGNQAPPTPIPVVNPEARRKKIAALKAQAELEAVKLREQVELKQRERVSQVTHVSPPRKQWAVSDTPISLEQQEATSKIKEETQSVVVFEHPPELPRAVWDEGNAPSPNVVPTDITTTPESTQKVETVVIFGKVDFPHTELENKGEGETFVVSQDNNQVGVVSEPVEIEPKSEVLAKSESSSSNEGVEPEQKETPEIKPCPIDGNVPVIKEAWIEGKEAPPTQDKNKDMPTTNIVKEDPVNAGNEVGVSTSVEEPSLSIEDLEENKGDNNDNILLEEPEIPLKHSSPLIPAANEDDVLLEYEAELEEREKEDIVTITLNDTTSCGHNTTNTSLTNSIKFGVFDTSVKILHTCSLPDLRVLFANDQDESSDKEMESTPPTEISLEKDGQDDTNDNVGVVSDEDKDENEDNEDEDLEKMIQTLQKVYKEVSSPPPTKIKSNDIIHSDEVDKDRNSTSLIQEDWQDSDNDSPVNTYQLSDDFKVFGKLETMRETLEEAIGLESLTQAYTLIQKFQCDDDEVSEDDFPLVELTSLIGEEHSQHFPALIHLVIADSVYTEFNTQRDEYNEGGNVQLLPTATSLEVEP